MISNSTVNTTFTTIIINEKLFLDLLILFVLLWTHLFGPHINEEGRAPVEASGDRDANDAEDEGTQR